MDDYQNLNRYRKMVREIEDFTDPDSLRTIMANAKRLNKPDIWRRAFRALCKLEGQDRDDPLTRDFFEVLTAYEQLLTEKHGRTTKASRTRQKLQNKGVVQCLDDWAVSAKPTEGFELLIRNGLQELTGEYLVLRYPERFSKEAVDGANRRLRATLIKSA